MDYKILKSTEKAHLIDKDGVTFWIPKTWIAEDGCLSERALDKYQDALADADFDATKSKGVMVSKETEKAICLTIIGTIYGMANAVRDLWIPKSLINNRDFCQRKADEIKDFQFFF